MSLATLLAQVITEMKNDPTCRRYVGPLEAALTEPPVSGDTPTEPVRPLEALIDKIFVAGQMDAQGHAAEKFKIGSGGTVLALSRRFLKEAADDLSALLQAAAPPAPTAEREPPAKVKQAVFLYLNTLVITSDNIGDIRRSLFMPFDCKWNGWVRDMTAELENKSSCAAPPERVSEGKEQL